MAESEHRKIIHVDMDAFFASVEQRDDPGLRGRPVAVGYAAARGVVAAASYEARVHGVRSALPSVTAMRRCPQLIFVPPRFDVYKTVSRQIHAIFEEFTDLIQPLSLDEAYLDVTNNRQGLPTAWLTAKAIRKRIFEVTGLTASAGISYNKFLAKLASDQRKPNGQFAVTPGMGADWVETLPVSRFHGVGPVTAAKMARLGIETGADLRAKPMAFLQEHFGSSADWYHDIARGIDDRPVNPNRERKSSGSETTFDRDLMGDDEIVAGVLGQADDVWAWCQKADAYGRTVTVKVKYADFHNISRSRTHGTPVTTQADLRDASMALIRSVLPTEKGIRLVGVTVSNFDRAVVEDGALPLFEGAQIAREAA
ncbi:DNA polymerase IV [Sphingobium boeckii]|uniref:DNA polymerase IV n=1 Tax=Sphingobium boeckii TaxID=1082345 RepID=A0A7W9AG26_9SPHN|nr:DNA polymerase IV [Sphingobium boeckii]MBB5684974.1 DNA polymerase-4 [Sphingobium boeckii]